VQLLSDSFSFILLRCQLQRGVVRPRNAESHLRLVANKHDYPVRRRGKLVCHIVFLPLQSDRFGKLKSPNHSPFMTNLALLLKVALFNWFMVFISIH